MGSGPCLVLRSARSAEPARAPGLPLGILTPEAGLAGVTFSLCGGLPEWTVLLHTRALGTSPPTPGTEDLLEFPVTHSSPFPATLSLKTPLGSPGSSKVLYLIRSCPFGITWKTCPPTRMVLEP